MWCNKFGYARLSTEEYALIESDIVAVDLEQSTFVKKQLVKVPTGSGQVRMGWIKLGLG